MRRATRPSKVLGTRAGSRCPRSEVAGQVRRSHPFTPPHSCATKNPRAVVGTPGGSGRRGRGRWGGWECPAAPQGGRKKPPYSRRAAVRDAQKRCANQRGSLTRPRVRLALHAPDACFTPWRRAEWQVGPLRGSGPSRIPFACCLPFIRASPFRRSSVLEASVPTPPFIARACGTREVNPTRSRESGLDQLHPMLAPQFRHL